MTEVGRFYWPGFPFGAIHEGPKPDTREREGRSENCDSCPTSFIDIDIVLIMFV